MVFVERLSGTQANVRSVIGGAAQTRTVTAPSTDELEAHITEAKAEIGAAAPFFRVERANAAHVHGDAPRRSS